MALRRKSRGEVSNAASSNAGATNSANASSGSIRICGANGKKARPAAMKGTIELVAGSGLDGNDIEEIQNANPAQHRAAR